MESERIVKGIWFPIEIWEADDLDWNEKILLLEIDSFTSKGMDCYMSNEYIAKMFKISDRKAGDMVNDLIAKGYVVKTRFDGRRRFIESNIITKLAGQTGKKRHSRLAKNNIADSQDLHPNYSKINNDSSNHQSNNKGSRFMPPTESEVEAYCRERGNAVNAEAFIAYYESNGWMIGKNRMKDWKAAVRTWEQRDRMAKPQVARKAQPRESNRQRLDRIAQELLGGFSYDGTIEEQ